MTADFRKPPSALVIPGGLRNVREFEAASPIAERHPPKHEPDPESMPAFAVSWMCFSISYFCISGGGFRVANYRARNDSDGGLDGFGVGE